MVNIGDFAGHGRVPVRMLRHYDAIGLLRLRRARLAGAIAADELRLARVEARLRTIESEGTTPAHDVVVKPVPSVRVAQLTAVAASYAPEGDGAVPVPEAVPVGPPRSARLRPPPAPLHHPEAHLPGYRTAGRVRRWRRPGGERRRR
ncbi:hypothetical protein [Kitasatospora brasiliensis]|uniref:hypothetical protein n=1 Tax=Kitasatospora brasiliensis TaxID=3058040 RepID=UPI003D77B063